MNTLTVPMNRKPPKYQRHSSGQARVKYRGKVHYLGKFGSPESWELYREYLTRWGFPPAAPAEEISEEAAQKIGELLEEISTLKAFAYHARIGKELLDLLHVCESFIIYKSNSDDYYSLTANIESQSKQTLQGDDLLELLLSLRNKPDALKRCYKCGRFKPKSQFSRLRSSRQDGRNIYCLVCERKRVLDHKRKRRASH